MGWGKRIIYVDAAVHFMATGAGARGLRGGARRRIHSINWSGGGAGGEDGR